ncbi:hypothetical protein V8F33_002353 [Rhypophila sp. PSN 637]
MDAPVNPNGREQGWISRPQPHGTLPPPVRHGPMVPFNDPSASNTAACYLVGIIGKLNSAVERASREDDPDIEAPKVLFHVQYGFETRGIQIPKTNDKLVLEFSEKMIEWVEEYGHKSNLLVLYYALHSTPVVNMVTRWRLIAISKLEGFSVATLYAELHVHLNDAPLDREGRQENGYRLRKQPIHFAQVANKNPQSITLRPVGSKPNLAKLEASQPSDKVARVVISITLADDEPDDYSPTAIERWLASYYLRLEPLGGNEVSELHLQLCLFRHQ